MPGTVLSPLILLITFDVGSVPILLMRKHEEDKYLIQEHPASKRKESESESGSVVSDSLWPHGLHSPWNSPGQNTGVGSHSLLQGLFPTQGSNPGLPHCRRILHQLSHNGSPRTLEWVAYPFSRGSCPPRNQTRISCIAGGFFTNWAIREDLCHIGTLLNFSNITCYIIVKSSKSTYPYLFSSGATFFFFFLPLCKLLL